MWRHLREVSPKPFGTCKNRHNQNHRNGVLLLQGMNTHTHPLSLTHTQLLQKWKSENYNHKNRKEIISKQKSKQFIYY